jgi:hypothetical protein
MTDDAEAGASKGVARRTMVRVSVLAAVVLLGLIGWLAFDFLLLLFAAILFGVLIEDERSRLAYDDER